MAIMLTDRAGLCTKYVRNAENHMDGFDRRGGNSGNTTKEPFPRRFNRWYYALGYGSKLPVQKTFAVP